MFLAKQYTTDNDGMVAVPPRARPSEVITSDKYVQVQLLIPDCDRTLVEIPYPERKYADVKRQYHVAEYHAPATWTFDISRIAISDTTGLVAIRVLFGGHEVGGTNKLPFGEAAVISLDPVIISSHETTNTPLSVRLYSEEKILPTTIIKFKSVERESRDDGRVIAINSDWNTPRAFNFFGGYIRPMWPVEILEVVERKPTAPTPPPVVVPPPKSDETVMSITVSVTVPRGSGAASIAVAPVAPPPPERPAISEPAVVPPTS